MPQGHCNATERSVVADVALAPGSTAIGHAEPAGVPGGQMYRDGGIRV